VIQCLPADAAFLSRSPANQKVKWPPEGPK
jgi:hypothetical protein